MTAKKVAYFVSSSTIADAKMNAAVRTEHACVCLDAAVTRGPIEFSLLSTVRKKGFC